MRAALAAAAALLLASGATAPRAAERETTYVYPPFKHTLGMQRVGELELKLFLGPGAKIDNPQGLAAGKPESRDDATTERDDDELTLLAVNAGRGEIIYNPSQTSLKRYGRLGSGEGEFSAPRGIAIERGGLVAVADTGNRRVVLLRLGEKALEWVGALTAADGPISPTAVAFAADQLWVTDFASGRVLRFSLEGRWLDAFPLAAALSGPLALAVQAKADAWNQSGQFTLAVIDAEGARVSAFDETGALRARAEAASLVAGPARFGYPVIDLHGQIVLPDSLGSRLVKLDEKLRVLDVIDHIDDDEKPLDRPNSLALYRRFGQLFVAEAKGGSYAWTGTEIGGLRLTRADGQGQPGLQIDYRLSEPSLVSAQLLAGGETRELMAPRRRRAGERREWVALPPALGAEAVIVLRAQPTYSARQQLTAEQRAALPPAGERP
ncbi:hypothetical protein FJ251_07440 [bacterium]|nr:hypothetical protein [bacterium]